MRQVILQASGLQNYWRIPDFDLRLRASRHTVTDKFKPNRFIFTATQE